MTDVTQILSQIEQGDEAASDKLLPLLYDELRKLAAAKLAQEKPGQTLQATALVHDAYLRLVKDGSAGSWQSRGHFFAAAAEAMRRILVENARRKGRIRHGGGGKRVTLNDMAILSHDGGDETLDVHEVFSRFAAREPEKAALVKLRFYAGLSIDEAADLLQISRTTAKRYWAYARAWMLAELNETDVS